MDYEKLLNELIVQLNENMGNRLTVALANGILMKMSDVVKANTPVPEIPVDGK